MIPYSSLSSAFHVCLLCHCDQLLVNCDASRNCATHQLRSSTTKKTMYQIVPHLQLFPSSSQPTRNSTPVVQHLQLPLGFLMMTLSPTNSHPTPSCTNSSHALSVTLSNHALSTLK